MDSFEELFEEQLKDLYFAEKLILRSLPKLAKKVSSKALHDAFLQHAEQTKGHLQRLEQVFEPLDKKPRGKRCAAMEGLMAEADELAMIDGFFTAVFAEDTIAMRACSPAPRPLSIMKLRVMAPSAPGPKSWARTR